MNVTCELESDSIAKLNLAIEKFIKETGRETWKVVQAQVKIFIKDSIRVTPPFGKAPFTESFNAQRAVGMKAVDRDIRRVFMKMEDFVKTIKSDSLRDALILNSGITDITTKKVKQRASRANMQALEAIFDRIGRHGQVIHKVIPELHAGQRDRRGRVSKKARRYVVVDGNSVERYIRETRKHVGSAKSGWLKAALGAGVKGIPRWISGAPKQLAGLYRPRNTDVEQSITFGNVGLAPEFYDRSKFDAIIQNNIHGMTKQMEAMAKRAAEKANRGSTI